jgi:cytochrome c5
MWCRSRTRSALSCCLAFLFAFATRNAAAPSAQAPTELPDGQAGEVVRAKCLICHRADLIRQQRLTRAGWERELDKMIQWGAEVHDTEGELVLDYLVSNFGPGVSLAASAAVGPGADVFKRRCLACHQADIVEQQRLGRAGWTREIDKMIRWGADVSDMDKEPLATYLTSAYGPRHSNRVRQ